MQRMTRQRSAITTALVGLDDFRSAQQLHAQLRASGTEIGLATVYRTLAALAEEGVVDVLRTDDGEARYRRCSRREHHHHLVCRVCGTAVELDGPGIEEWAAAMGARYGFRDVAHTMELVGTCPACAADEDARADEEDEDGEGGTT